MTSVSRLCDMADAGADGRLWYAHAADQVRLGADRLGIEAGRFADLLALFSPRVSVRRSIRMAVHYATTGQYAHDVMQSVRTAVAHYEATGAIRGPKTGPFARALRGDITAIVLDVWMSRALGVPQKDLERVGIHAEGTLRVRSAGLELGWPPAAAQAAIWHTVIRRAGRRPAAFTIVDDTLFGQAFI